MYQRPPVASEAAAANGPGTKTTSRPLLLAFATIRCIEAEYGSAFRQSNGLIVLYCSGRYCCSFTHLLSTSGFAQILSVLVPSVVFKTQPVPRNPDARIYRNPELNRKPCVRLQRVQVETHRQAAAAVKEKESLH
jgi:hypothetical protein